MSRQVVAYAQVDAIVLKTVAFWLECSNLECGDSKPARLGLGSRNFSATSSRCCALEKELKDVFDIKVGAKPCVDIEPASSDRSLSWIFQGAKPV